MTILQGTMQDGTVIPVQVDAQGRFVAQLAATALVGTRNVIINGELKINQRGVTIAAAAVGQYGPDRWKKVDAGNMTQIIEDVNFVPGAKYTLSWKGGTPQVLTAPASGHWTLPNIPITATEIQLELGEVATPFERRSYGQELALCQRYYSTLNNVGLARWVAGGTYGGGMTSFTYSQAMRANPSVTRSVNSGTFDSPAFALSQTGGILYFASGSDVGDYMDYLLRFSAEL